MKGNFFVQDYTPQVQKVNTLVLKFVVKSQEALSERLPKKLN